MVGVDADGIGRVMGAPGTGQGGVRRVRTGLSVTHELVVDGTRPHHHAYAARLPRYWPLKDYRGDVRIEERPNGCLIVWTVTSGRAYPASANGQRRSSARSTRD